MCDIESVLFQFEFNSLEKIKIVYSRKQKDQITIL